MYLTNKELKLFGELSQNLSFEKALELAIQKKQKTTFLNEHLYVLLSDSSVLVFSLKRYAHMFHKYLSIVAETGEMFFALQSILQFNMALTFKDTEISVAFLIPSNENENYRKSFQIIENVFYFESEHLASELSFEFTDIDTVVFKVELKTSIVFSQPINISDLYEQSRELASHRTSKD